MRPYAGWLFGVAAIANVVVAAALLVARIQLSAFVPLDPISGTNTWFANLAGALIGLFGVVYGLIARDPRTYRPCIGILAVGKLLAVGCAVMPWIEGETSYRLALLLSPDVVFAVLFLDYLRRTRVA
jgi:hypothetical protein